ncbi:uromodulin-like [Xyrauchen texanus]|uniref:uromodulin-like n=1 Tax=Xyrauchen texanus TaxID=154827 RepID=UPI002241C91E|nr:uromodulin-like [Xyrauchen texanus]
MGFLIPLCVVLLLKNNEVYTTTTPSNKDSFTEMTTSIATATDPCYDYNILEDYWRDIRQYGNYGHDDTLVEWNGWYRFYLNREPAQLSEWCVHYISCGGNSGLKLKGSHPHLEDGVVTREVLGFSSFDCDSYRSNPIQIKACPGDYYVYKLVKPDESIYIPSYCAVTFFSPTVDPCDSYTSLDEPWRSTSNTYSYNYNYHNSVCDYNVNWNGWYRLFYQGQSAQMPESCVNYGSCGTYHPLWLNGHHPQLEDGVVTRQVCASSWSDCCDYRSYPIQVKACPGNYYVYEFVSPTFCSAYCAEVRSLNPSSTTMPMSITTTAVTDPCVELKCTDGERCGEKDGIYGCLCNENHLPLNHNIYDSFEICESSSGFLSLSRCQLFEDGFPAEKLHLSDSNCKGTVQNGRVEFHFDSNDHLCGTKLMANGTHFIYENVILGEVESTQEVIRRKSHLKLPVSCIYPQSQSFSMNMHINPLESILHRKIPAGQGTYKVRIVPYQDPEFSQPFTGSLNVEVDQPIFVEVAIDGIDGQQSAMLIDACWATPVNDPHYDVRWDLIVGECPNPKDDTVDLLQNGVSTSGRFSFRMFTFTADSDKVFLHCSVHLCLLKNNDCSAHCEPGYHRRIRRSLDFHDTASISVGPLIRTKSKTDKWATD